MSCTLSQCDRPEYSSEEDCNYKPDVKALHNAWHLTDCITSALHYVAILCVYAHECVCARVRVRACVSE
jgi:predicted membrane channel-forming protein YqfA (hemolysin III family)